MSLDEVSVDEVSLDEITSGRSIRGRSFRGRSFRGRSFRGRNYLWTIMSGWSFRGRSFRGRLFRAPYRHSVYNRGVKCDNQFLTPFSFVRSSRTPLGRMKALVGVPSTPEEDAAASHSPSHQRNDHSCVSQPWWGIKAIGYFRLWQATHF